MTDDEKFGSAIIRRALEEPLRQIAENAGMEGSVVVERVKGEKKGIGFTTIDENDAPSPLAGEGRGEGV